MRLSDSTVPEIAALRQTPLRATYSCAAERVVQVGDETLIRMAEDKWANAAGTYRLRAHQADYDPGLPPPWLLDVIRGLAILGIVSQAGYRAWQTEIERDIRNYQADRIHALRQEANALGYALTATAMSVDVVARQQRSVLSSRDDSTEAMRDGLV